jgi:hypothetical protein
LGRILLKMLGGGWGGFQIAVYRGTRRTASGGQEPFWKKVLGSPKTFKKA